MFSEMELAVVSAAVLLALRFDRVVVARWLAGRFEGGVLVEAVDTLLPLAGSSGRGAEGAGSLCNVLHEAGRRSAVGDVLHAPSLDAEVSGFFREVG